MKPEYKTLGSAHDPPKKVNTCFVVFRLPAVGFGPEYQEIAWKSSPGAFWTGKNLQKGPNTIKHTKNQNQKK